METTRREMVMAAGAMAATAMTPTAFAAAWTPNYVNAQGVKGG